MEGGKLEGGFRNLPKGDGQMGTTYFSICPNSKRD